MIGKIIIMLLLVGVISFASIFIYQNMPGGPQSFKIISNDAEARLNISYGPTPMYMANIRFNHKSLTYSLSPSCDLNRKDKMLEAFLEIEKRVSILSFSEVSENEDIYISCSEEELKEGENLFRAGEGGPSKIINTSLYNVILNGEILLYRQSECDYPVVELHELLHVFGFDHSSNPLNVMYNISNCDQRMSEDIVKTLNSLYSINELPDLHINDVNATKKGRYLDFEIFVRNQGLTDAENVSLSIESNGKNFKTYPLGNISIGMGRVLQTTNMKLPSRSTESIKFMIDKENKISELNENNNWVELTVKD